MTTSEKRSACCSSCGGPLPATSPLGFCPACLLAPAGSNDDSPVRTGVAENTDSPRGERIGAYRILQKIGEGGFGVVYRALQTEPVRREVALKLIKPGMDSAEVLARFQAERQALAMMDHPHIASVFDGGITAGGRPYFVMELVSGLPLTEFCRRESMALTDRLKLFVKICRAVHHAHQKGIIHRDLKPGNILVTLKNGEPVPKIIDFGVAKALEHSLVGPDLFTSYGQMVGTPEYMSPEQASMSGLDADTRSDVYSLGALLYELISGHTPLNGDVLRTAAYDEVLRVIRETVPPRPSTRRPPDDVKPSRQLRVPAGDLDWIALKALEKDRARRYDSANALAEDVERYLACEPIIARPPSRLYHFGKFCRRNKTLVAAATISLLALLFSVVLSLSFAIRADDAKRAALAAAHVSSAAEQETLTHLVGIHILNGTRNADEGDLWTALLWYRRAWALDKQGSRLESSHRMRIASVLARCPKLEGLAIQPAELDDAALNATGNRLFTRADQQNHATLWDPETGTRVGPPLAHRGVVNQGAFDRTGARLVTSGEDGFSRLWEAKTGAPLASAFEHPGPVHWSEFSPDGSQLITACEDGRVRIWDAARPQTSPREIHLPDAALYSHFTADGTLILTADAGGMARLWRYPTLEQGGELPHFMRPGDPLDRIVLPPQMADGNQYMATVTRARLHFLDLAGKSKSERMVRPILNGLSLGQEGGRYLWVGKSSTACLVDYETGSNHLELLHPREIQYGDIAPGGSRLVTSSSLGLVHLWDAREGRALVPPIRHIGTIQQLNFLQDDRHALVASRDGTARIWNMGDLSTSHVPYDFQCGRSHLIAPLPGMPGGSLPVRTFSPDGEWEVRGSMGTNEVRILHRLSGRPQVVIPTLAPALAVRFSADAQRVLIVGSDQASLHDARTGAQIGLPIQIAAVARSIEMNSEASRIAFLTRDQSVEVWEVEPHRRLLRICGPDSAPQAGARTVSLPHPPGGRFAISARGDRIAIAEDGYGRSVHSIALDSSDHVSFLPAAGRVASVSFDETGRWIAVASSSTFARVWDASTGMPVSPAIKHPTFVRAAAFSPDGQRMVTLESRSAAKVWDWRKGDLLVSHGLPGGGETANVWFSADGKRLIFMNPSGAVSQWALPAFEMEESQVDSLVALLTGRRIDETGGIEILPVATFREDPERYLQAWRAWRRVDGSPR